MPKWLLPAAIGAGLGAIAGKGRFFKGRKGRIEEVSALTPEQQRVMGKLAPFLEERIGRGLPAWEGRFAAPLEPIQRAGLERLGEYVEDIPGITQLGMERYREALAGMSPEEVRQWWEMHRAPQWRRMWEEEMVPAMREARVAPGTLYGTPYVTDVERAAQRWGEAQQAELGNVIMQERAAARAMLPYLPMMEEAPLRRAQAAIQLGEVARGIEQAELAGRLEEFRRTAPELSPVLNYALQLLGIPAKAMFYRPGRPSPFMQLLGAAAPIIGAGLGGALGGPAGAAVGGGIGTGVGGALQGQVGQAGFFRQPWGMPQFGGR